ncbi:hypothetical protein [Streptomyces fulvoviolaceus]|uniref:hypothetical protein n=1 Tax=Streptomyces fulvoviolaceus TaxID=285535 RepID=UPI0021BE629B|nr:hypothetical protein [Streptomyces fulvoviolaceus]MCT9082053.1 hypothetical protein [Streptomyces fulvoviolaceus]
MTLITRRSVLTAGTVTVGAVLIPAASATAGTKASGKRITVGSRRDVRTLRDHPCEPAAWSCD